MNAKAANLYADPLAPVRSADVIEHALANVRLSMPGRPDCDVISRARFDLRNALKRLETMR